MRSTLLSAIAACIALVNAFANPLPCKGLCSNSHDPSIVRRGDGKYFRFSTGGQISVHTAPSLTGPWTGAGMALGGTGDMWAPDVHFGGDTYYLYYAVSSFGTQNSFIGVATSKTMEPGSWTDHGSTGITSKTGNNFNAIDPNFIRVRGVNFLTFGSFWKGIHQTTLSADALTGPDTAPHMVESEPKRSYATEGAYVYAHGGYYYLFFSEGQCCGYDKRRPPPGGEYKIKVCRSKAVNGGFVDQSGVSCEEGGGTLVLGSHGNVYGPGGQGVYDDPTEGPVLYYHYVDTNYGYGDGSKFLGVNRIDFSSGWPVV